MRWLRRFQRDRSDRTMEPAADPAAERAPTPTEPPTERTGLRADVSAGIPSFEVGDRIADTYRVERLLGQGGMGTVYQARHLTWDLDVVVKVPRPELLADPAHRWRITVEAEAWTTLGLHPNIAYCYYVHPVDDVLLLVVEHVDGGNLSEWIAGGRCASLATALDLAIQCCHGLEHAHAKGMIHRDVKPANLLVGMDGTLKVTDFGIARLTEATAETTGDGGADARVGQTVGGIGTYEYMAPEQFAAAHDVDARADVFALGVCLYELFCGRRPYEVLAVGARHEPPEPAALRGDDALPERLGMLLRRTVDWERGRRPATAREVRGELCAVYETLFGRASAFAELPELSLEADASNNRGVSYVYLGKAPDADAAWAEALAADPQHLEATYNRGVARWRRGELTDTALVCLLQSVADARADRRARALLVRVHLERGDLDAAAALLEVTGAAAGEREDEALPEQLASGGVAEGRCVGVLEGAGAVTHMAVGSDRWVLSAAWGGALMLWDLMGGTCVRTFEEMPEEIWAVCLARDGSWALSAGHGTLRFWDATTGRWLGAPEGYFEQPLALAPSAGGRAAVSGDADGTVQLWDVPTRRLGSELKGHREGVTAVTFVGDDRWVLSGSHDRTLRLWDVTTGGCVRVFEEHSATLRSVSASGVAQRALAGCDDGTLWLWNLGSGECMRVFRQHGVAAAAVSLSPDGRWAVSASGDQVRLWEMDTGRCLRTFNGHTDEVKSVHIFAEAKRALSASGDGTLRLWQLPQPAAPCCAPRLSRPPRLSEILKVDAEVKALLREANAALDERRFTVAHERLSAARLLPGRSRTAAVREAWNRLAHRCTRVGVRTAWRAKTLEGHAGRVTSVSNSADARWALTAVLGHVAGSNHPLLLWDLETGRAVRRFEGFLGTSARLSRDGRWAIAWSFGGEILLWEVATGQRARTFEVKADTISDVDLSTDARWALSGSDEGPVRLWDGATGRCIRTFEARDKGAASVRLLDGASLVAVSTSGNQTVNVWDAATGSRLRTLEGHVGGVRAVDTIADGRWLLSLDAQVLRLWDTDTWECVGSCDLGRQASWAASASWDGRWAVSGSMDGTLHVWDLTTSRCVRTFEGEEGSIEAIALTSDGRRVVCGGRDGRVRLWEIDWELEPHEPADWDEAARRHLAAFLTRQTPYASADVMSPDGLSRRGRPSWSDEDLKELLRDIGHAGYGWLDPMRVLRELEHMASAAIGTSGDRL